MSEDNPYSVPSDTHKISPETATPAEQGVFGNWPITYTANVSPIWAIAFPMFLGAGAIVMALLMFAVHLFLIDHTSQFSLHATTTMPMIGGVFSILSAIGSRNATKEVLLWKDGIETRGRKTAIIRWTEIADVSVRDSSSPGAIGQKVMTLAGIDGEPIAKVTGPLAKDETLTKQMTELAAGSSPVLENGSSERSISKKLPPTSKAAKKKGRINAVITGLGGVLLLLAGIFLPLNAYWESNAAQRMASEGTAGVGRVKEKKLAPNGRTCRLYVEVESVDGSTASHNFEVTQDYYASVSTGDMVPIRTVPDDPNIAELLSGQVQHTDMMDTPIVSFALGAFGLIASLFMLPMTVLMWKGYDINFNKGKFQVVPMT